jgi:ATP-dependent helicase/nuclease subunit A
MLSTGSIHRETAFNIAIRCSEVYKDLPEEITGGETMLLQGVIDCWLETGDGILLLDYKTDFVPEGGSNIIKERYRVQIDYYTMALERVTGKKVTEKYLYLFYNGELVSV